MNPSCMRDFVSSRALRIISRAPWYSVSRVFVSRAIPCCIALRATAVASRAKTSISSIVGTMCVSSRPFSSATFASSSAAAMHISSVIVRARTSSVPRKIPGKPRLLLTWFGKSDRPVAITRAPASAASHGQISGTGLDQELRGPDVGGPCADERDRDVGHLLPHDLERVDQTGDVDRRGALLVVVPHRDLTLLPEPLQNRETLRLRDVLEVDTAERGRDELDRLDDFLGVLRRERNRERVDASEILEQQGLAFHDGQSGLGPDVAEAQDARPVRYDGDLIPLVRQGPHLARVRGDVEAGLRDPRGVPDREVVEAADGHPRDDLDLALVVRVVLRGLFLRKVRALQVLFDFLGSRRFHAFVAPALFRGHHGSTKRGREESSGLA